MLELTSAQAVRDHYRSLRERTWQWRKPPIRRKPIPIVDSTPKTVTVKIIKAKLPQLPISLAIQLFGKSPQSTGHPTWKPSPIVAIRDFVARKYKVSLNDLIGHRRHKHITYIRHIAIYLCKTTTGASYPQIGRQFGNRDHTSIMYAVRRIERESTLDPDFATELVAMAEAIQRPEAQ